MSNFSLVVRSDQVQLYPLYDNGRSLFHEQRPEFIDKALEDIPSYSSEFGLVGIYYDAVMEIAHDTDLNSLINLNLNREEIMSMYSSCNLPNDRLYGLWSGR